MTRQHHIQVRVSPDDFAANIRFLRHEVAPTRLCVVMKSNAYGHGLEGLLPAAVRAGAHCLGICTNPEAARIRRHEPGIRLLRLRSALAEELDESVAGLDVEEQVGSPEMGAYLDAAGRRRGRPVPVHLKLDTGMGRSGFLAPRLEQVKRVCGLPGLRVVGIMTHLAKADAPDLTETRDQLEDFRGLLQALRDVLPASAIVHSHNSAATIRLPDSRGDLVRVGAACYGVRTSRAFSNPAALRPVMAVRTRVLEVRRLPAGHSIGYGGRFVTRRSTRIASVPVGFGEGYPRALFNRGIVLIQGRRCPVVGRVSLNILTIDVTDLPRVPTWGDEVVLVGSQGDASIGFEELADAFDSVHTELNLMFGGLNQVCYA